MGNSDKRAALERLDALRRSRAISEEDYIALVAGLASSAPGAGAPHVKRPQGNAHRNPGPMANVGQIALGAMAGTVAADVLRDQRSNPNAEAPQDYELTSSTRSFQDDDGATTTEYVEYVDYLEDDDGDPGGFDFGDFSI